MIQTVIPKRHRMFAKRWLVVATVALFLAGLASTARAQTRVVADHPRLFLRAADVPALKERCGTVPEVRDAYRLVREFAYGNAMQTNLWVAPDELSAVLLAYVVEDRDPKLLARARRYVDAFGRAEGDSWTWPLMLKALAQAYDWLHDDLTTQERKKLADRMIELVGRMRGAYRHSDYNNHVYLERGPVLFAGLALANDGIADAFADEALVEGRTFLKEHFIPTVNQLGGGGAGGWHESMSYWSLFAYEFAHQLEAWRTATGEDLFAACPGLGGVANWLVHCTRPHDDSMAAVADINTPIKWGQQETRYLTLIAARYRDGLAQHVAHRVPPRYPGWAWSYILWYDPALEVVELRSLPTGTLFPGLGWAAMRSSWESDAVWALFVCGDYYAGHQHSDQNSFVIGHRGDLATDAGEYGAKATAFHNTVLIGEGQRRYGSDPRARYAPTKPGSEFDTGDILGFEEHPLFTYVSGDASNAYGAFENGRRVEKAPTFVRRFIFLEPDTFVVDDQITRAVPGQPVRWLLHARNEPDIQGRQVRITEGDGELICETLLPGKVSVRSAPQVGGRKKRGDYRIDVVPQDELSELRFLHVIHVRKRGDDRSIARTKLRREETALQLEITTNERVFRLTFPEGKIDAGAIAVTRTDGQVLLPQRPFPSGVLPYDAEGVRLIERWDSAYHGDRRPPWDTGRPAAELKKSVEDGTLRPCRAVVLGCGTGTNAIYLAQHGFDVTGIDIAPTALARARTKATQAGARVRWILADVLAPPALEPFDLIFDRGCYHGVRRGNAAGYVETIRKLSQPGSRLLLLAGNANEPPPHTGPPRVKEEALRADFAEEFTFEWLRETHFDTPDPNETGALAWSVLLRRR